MALPLLPILALGIVVAASARKGGVGGSRPGKGFAKLPKLGAMTQAQRLEAALSSWLALLDAIAKGYGAYYPASYEVDSALRPGRLLWTTSDAWAWPRDMVSETARDLWDSGEPIRKGMVQQADELLRSAVELGAEAERKHGPLTLADGSEVSLVDVAEQYASDAAISKLVAMVPGAGTIAALAEAVGVGWSNTSGRREVSSEELRIEWVHARHLAFSRARDLVRYATAV